MKKKSEMEKALAPIMRVIVWKCVADECFGKTSTWMYQRLHGYVANGKPIEMTDEKKQQLRKYLIKLGAKIIATAEKL